MRWAINQITLHGGSRRAPDDLPAELAALRAGGWRAIEVWLAHWDPFIERNGLAAARKLLDGCGLLAPGGCGLGGGGSLFFSEGAALASAHATLDRRLEQCAALGATHLVIAPGFELPPSPAPGDLERAVRSIRRAGETAARYGVRLGIECLAAARLVRTVQSAWWVADRVGHPMVGVILDTYHLYAGPSKTEDLDLLAQDPQKLFFVHVSDVDGALPRDLWAVPDRTLPLPPGQGGVPNGALLERAERLGYDGWVSLELFSTAFEAQWEHDPHAAAALAYQRCLTLMPDGP